MKRKPKIYKEEEHNGSETIVYDFSKKTKQKSISKLKKEVWVVFSKYIRLKYSDWRGYCSCVTCGVTKQWKEMQAGHFLQGRHNEVLYDERNVHVQCYQCNCPKHGNLIPYYEFMLKKYGKKVIDKLKKLNDKNKQFTRKELKELKDKYQDIINKLT